MGRPEPPLNPFMEGDMKKYFIGLMVFVLLISVASGAWRDKKVFLATAVDCGAGVTLVDETGFTSAKISIPWNIQVALVTVTFTRAAGSTPTVDFYFRVSYDNGTTWANYRSTISIPTNEPIISGTTCRVSQPVYFYGVSHIRLWKIVNTDAANALTAVNATLSY